MWRRAGDPAMMTEAVLVVVYRLLQRAKGKAYARGRHMAAAANANLTGLARAGQRVGDHIGTLRPCVGPAAISAACSRRAHLWDCVHQQLVRLLTPTRGWEVEARVSPRHASGLSPRREPLCPCPTRSVPTTHQDPTMAVAAALGHCRRRPQCLHGLLHATALRSRLYRPHASRQRAWRRRVAAVRRRRTM